MKHQRTGFSLNRWNRRMQRQSHLRSFLLQLEAKMDILDVMAWLFRAMAAGEA